ncbi:hemerythrin domain-containing protein [Kitasatospora paranensis]|uniref:Hemerythrin domain-containing protein n=1 Tax=Kitasatospora paranensis TaxID=258053 RepID=A0ABW2G849_9ACTN
MTGHGADVIAELEADHREVQMLFARIAVAPRTELQELVHRVSVELVRHSIAEEAYLYPAVRAHVLDGDRLADKEVADHAQVERLLKGLEGRSPADADFDPLLRTLSREVGLHIQDEEQRLFPALASGTTPEELMKLGDRVRATKAMSPTRPHPDAPSSATARRLLAPGIGLIDRVRDYVSGRG